MNIKTPKSSYGTHRDRQKSKLKYHNRIETPCHGMGNNYRNIKE